jgi:hypothetical protein
MKFVPADLGKYKILLFVAAVVIALLLMGKVEVQIPSDWWMYAIILLIIYLYFTRPKKSTELRTIHDVTRHISNDMTFQPPGIPIEWGERPVFLKRGDTWYVQPNPNAQTITCNKLGEITQTVDIDPVKFMRSEESSSIASGALMGEVKDNLVRKKAREAGWDVQEDKKDKEDDEEE